MPSSEKIREELAKPFDSSVLQSRSKGGQNLTYVPVSEVIARLNLVLGTENWSEEYSKTWISPEYPGCMVSEVKISATINGVTTYKIGYGGEDIKFYKAGSANEGKPLDLGDSFKGAHSDAFKKACTALGVGLDIARKTDALDHEESERQRLEDDAQPLAEADQIEAIHVLIKELTEDEKTEFKSWWRENVPYGLTSGKLTQAHVDRISVKLGV